MGVVEIRQVSHEEKVVVITLPSIKLCENGVYMFNRIENSKMFLKKQDILLDIERHFAMAKEELNKILEGEIKWE